MESGLEIESRLAELSGNMRECANLLDSRDRMKNFQKIYQLMVLIDQDIGWLKRPTEASK